MSEEPARDIKLVEDFYNGLLEIQAFSDEHGGKGRQLIGDIMDFAYDIIVPQPRDFPAYIVTQHPEREYRRAIFRKKFALIYRVAETELSFLVVYSTKQTPPALPLSA